MADAVADGTTTITSASAGFVAGASGHAGNGVNIAGAWYEITAVNSATSITVDRTVAAATGLVLRVGGALDHPATAGGSLVASNVVHVKAGTYLHGATANVSGGRLAASASNLTIIGYQSAREDGGTRPVMRANAASITIWTVSGSGSVVRNVDFYRDPAGGLASVTGLGAGNAAESCRAQNCNIGFTTSSSNARFRLCQADGCATGFTATFGGALYAECVATSCASSGFFSSSAISWYRGCVASACVTGFSVGPGSFLDGCLATGSTTGHGFSSGPATLAVRSLATFNGNVGFNGGMRLADCGGHSNASGNYSNAGDAGVERFVALAADPFVDRAGGNFGLNDAAGGGALLKSVGSALPGLAATTSHPDIGAVQALPAAAAASARPVISFGS